jgi:lycopene cyclase domain-containing protein
MYYFSVLFLIIVAALFIEWKFKEHLFHSLKERLICTAIALASITIWDWYAIPRDHWIFTGEGIAGIYVGPIPIEEFFWAMFVPYLWVTLYKMAHIIFDKKNKKWRS